MMQSPAWDTCNYAIWEMDGEEFRNTAGAADAKYKLKRRPFFIANVSRPVSR